MSLLPMAAAIIQLSPIVSKEAGLLTDGCLRQRLDPHHRCILFDYQYLQLTMLSLPYQTVSLCPRTSFSILSFSLLDFDRLVLVCTFTDASG